jgi:hypothetical protein
VLDVRVALYEVVGDQLQLVGKNPVAATWGNWNRPPDKNTIQVTWLRDNVALVTSSDLLSGPTAMTPGQANLICYVSNKHLVGLLIAPNLIKEALEVTVNSLAAPCAPGALSDATLLLNQAPTAIRPLPLEGNGLPILEIFGIESSSVTSVRFRRFECHFFQGKYACDRR